MDIGLIDRDFTGFTGIKPEYLGFVRAKFQASEFAEGAIKKPLGNC